MVIFNEFFNLTSGKTYRTRDTAVVFNDDATVRLVLQFVERERGGKLLGHFRTKCLELMTAM